MNDKEEELQSKRLEEYNRLKKLRDDIRANLRTITSDDKDGPCNQGPFTANTRESRRVLSMTIQFTETLGKSPAISKYMSGLNIEAWELGNFLEDMLLKNLRPIEEAMEKL